MTNGKTAIVTGAGTGIGKAVATALLQARLEHGVLRPPQGRARRSDRGRGSDRGEGAGHRLRHHQAGRGRRHVRDASPRLSAASTCSSTMPASASRPTLIDEIPVEDVERRSSASTSPDRSCARAPRSRVMRRQQPHGRAHHQQRLGLGACAASGFGALHRDQARHHRPDQDAGARRPAVRHRLRPDRHRQCADRHGGADDGRRAAGQRHDRRRAGDGRRSASPMRSSTWPACRSTPTCCS